MKRKTGKTDRILNARPDTLDFRDKMYEAALHEVPVTMSLQEYKKYKIPVLDQGQEGACTGFGLATVANYLLTRRKVVPDKTPVSPRMFYHMARRYDEWSGENYDGSSARGAIKGWHKHGVCSANCWPYEDNTDFRLTETRVSDALLRPLGAYYRVNHKDIVAMHSAIAEVGILYATASVHEGWDLVGTDGKIPYTENMQGGHAFAIVAYDQEGFWIQNSWGKGWGKGGFALVSYDDWLENGTDVWVAMLGAPIKLLKLRSNAIAHSAAAEKSESYSFADLRPHIISIGNNGKLNQGGSYGTSPEELISIFENDIPNVTKNWKKKRLLLYAHGGLVSEKAAIQRLADYRHSLLQAEVYPLSFIWRSDAWTTITNILKDALQRRRPEGILSSAKDFMLDRLDDALEPIARMITGKLQWDEMKENALLATVSNEGGARMVLDQLKQLVENENYEIHIIGHSAGSIFMAPLIQLLTTDGQVSKGPLSGETGYGLKIASCTLWAPACTLEVFKEFYLSSIKDRTLRRFAVFNLNDKVEQSDHCAHIYNKSLLYLVSNSFEKKQRIPMFRDGVPLLGLQKSIEKDPELVSLFKSDNADLILSPNNNPEGSESHSTCNSHGGFDDDKATVNASLARILNKTKSTREFTFPSSASSLKDRRKGLMAKI